MADIFDQASDLESRERDAAISIALTKAANGPAPDWIDGVAHCHECGEVISPARLKAIPNCGLCRDCQEEYDQNN